MLNYFIKSLILHGKKPNSVLFYFQEYRGIVDDTRSSNNIANQSMIRRFNQHSTMVLRACSNSTPSSSTPDPIPAQSPAPSNGRKTKLTGSLNGVQPILNGATSSSTYIQEPHIKKVRNRFVKNFFIKIHFAVNGG